MKSRDFPRTEAQLRSWLRQTAGDRVAFTEMARGGTVGWPDCALAQPPDEGYFWLPIELKHWPEGVAGWDARPSQRRFHRLAHEAGRGVAFLAVVGDGSGPPVFTTYEWLTAPSEERGRIRVEPRSIPIRNLVALDLAIDDAFPGWERPLWADRR